MTEERNTPRDVTRLEQAVGEVEQALAEAEARRDEAQREIDCNRKRLEALVNSPTVAAARNGPIPSRPY